LHSSAALRGSFRAPMRIPLSHLGCVVYQPAARRLGYAGASRHHGGLAHAVPRQLPLHPHTASGSSAAKAVQAAEKVAVAASVAAAVAAAKHRRRTFATRKENFLRKPDKSPKGSIDDRILDLCGEINQLEAFFTTSSCSGRCFLWQGRHHGGSDGNMELEHAPALGVVEGSGSFVRFRVSHDLVDDLAAFDATRAPGQGPVWLALQGLQLDVCCREVAAAWRLMQLASGIFESAKLYAWKEGRWMVQMEGGELLDFPLSCPDGANPFIGQEAWLRDLVNQNLERNWRGINRLLAEIRKAPAALQPGSEADESLAAHGDLPALPGTPFDEAGAATSSTAELHASLADLCEELDRWPGLRVTAACSGRTCIALERPDGTAEHRRVGHGLVEDSGYFDAAELAASSGEGTACWFRLEPFFLQVWCRDLGAAAALVAAAGTAFRKPGLAWRDGRCLLEISGAERLEVPLVTPDGSRPYVGQEEWLRELANGDLRRAWDKAARLLAEVRATPAEAAEAAWGVPNVPASEAVGS